ncbi:MAG TPA: aminopeptidase [Candidatus Acidoferrales bacterium]|nr:aminopeptidase [Candidatus Acidoferrales bacterium]
MPAPPPFDPEYVPGARNAVRVCLRIRPEEKVTLITDRETQEIAHSIASEVAELGAPFRLWTLEDHAERPLRHMPQPVLADLDSSQVSVFAAQAQTGELAARMEMTAVVNRRHIRHAHMVNINRQIMLEGMRADFGKVDELSRRVWEMAGRARHVHAETPAGTRIEADLTPKYRWIKTSGIISPEKWGNLPGGEVFTTPAEVNGTYVVDGVVGDYLCGKYGNLESGPLSIRVEQNRVTEIHSENRELEDEFWRYTHTDDNSDRVGEFAIGTNIELKHVIGHILQDEKLPGIHIAFGNPYGEHTGAEWYSGTHIDVVGTRFSIWLDDRQIMQDGKFLL